MRPRPDSAPRGLSFAEVLITLALLSIVLLALIPLFTFSVKTNVSSNQLTQANTLAREKLDELLMYPSTDPRLSIPGGGTEANKDNCAECKNDLPSYYNPKTGEVSTAASTPGKGWFPYPVRRFYTVQAFRSNNLGTPLASVTADEKTAYELGAGAPYYDVKLVTVTVEPTSGAFPGLRRTVQSAIVRYRNAL